MGASGYMYEFEGPAHKQNATQREFNQFPAAGDCAVRAIGRVMNISGSLTPDKHFDSLLPHPIILVSAFIRVAFACRLFRYSHRDQAATFAHMLQRGRAFFRPVCGTCRKRLRQLISTNTQIIRVAWAAVVKPTLWDISND